MSYIYDWWAVTGAHLFFVAAVRRRGRPPYALILYQTFLALLAIGCVIVADKNAAVWHPAPVVVAEPAQDERGEEGTRNRSGLARPQASDRSLKPPVSEHVYFVSFDSSIKLHLRVREDLALQLFAGNRIHVLQLLALQISPMHRLILEAASFCSRRSFFSRSSKPRDSSSARLALWQPAPAMVMLARLARRKAGHIEKPRLRSEAEQERRQP